LLFQPGPHEATSKYAFFVSIEHTPNLVSKFFCRIIHPYALSRLLSYFSPGQDLSKNHAYFYATLVTVFSIAQTIFSHNYFLFLTGLGIRIRTALCSFLYRRLLQMSSNHSRKIPFGRIVTLLTKNVQTFESFVKCGNELWIGIVKLMASSYILYDKTGPSGLAGLAVFAIAVPLHGKDSYIESS
jgi:ATP-binding cassette subfamily C (CFTR/MRP) protein 4